MAYIRKLPSGRWQATVRLPSGKKTTRTHVTKRVVADWSREEESRIARGEIRDPRTGRVSYEEWRDQFIGARVVEDGTARRNRGELTNHLDPQWTGWRLTAITRIEVQGWVKRMAAAGVGAHAVRNSYKLLSAMLNAAVDEGLLEQSPCRRIDLPPIPPRLPEWFTREQVDAVCAHLGQADAAGAQLMSWCGLRWGECAGLRVGQVAFLRRRLTVDGVLTQGGAWKAYPKSSKSRREVPVPARVLELLAPLCVGKAPGDLVFVTEALGRPWSGSNWRKRWHAAIGAAGDVPGYRPHALRHTAASLLVQAGVPLYDVQRLLGHESPLITARYAHLAPDTHDAIEAAWGRAAHQRRMDPPGEAGPRG